MDINHNIVIIVVIIIINFIVIKSKMSGVHTTHGCLEATSPESPSANVASQTDEHLEQTARISSAR